MRRAASQPLLKHLQETDEDEGVEEAIIEDKAIGDVGPISKQITCMTLHKREPRKPCQEVFSCQKYRAWRQDLRSRASSLRKQLKARWAIQALIDEQISLFQAHFSRASGPTKLTDVAQLLMPKWIPAQEQAALFWLGDWRPSFILELLHSLAHSLWEPIGVERALAQLINDIRIEEAVIDEELTEIQANCVLYLPLGVVKNEKNGPGPGPALAQVRSEFKKIHRVIVKAQNLRMKALELAVKKVLGQIDAAEFLVAFVGIQDLIHKFSTKCKARNGPVCIKNLGATSSKFNLLMAEDSFLGSSSNSHI